MHGCVISEPHLLLHVFYCLLLAPMGRLAHDCMNLSCMNRQDIMTRLESDISELFLALLDEPRPQNPKVNVQFYRPRKAQLLPLKVHVGCDVART